MSQLSNIEKWRASHSRDKLTSQTHSIPIHSNASISSSLSLSNQTIINRHTKRPKISLRNYNQVYLSPHVSQLSPVLALLRLLKATQLRVTVAAQLAQHVYRQVPTISKHSLLQSLDQRDPNTAVAMTMLASKDPATIRGYCLSAKWFFSWLVAYNSDITYVQQIKDEHIITYLWAEANRGLVAASINNYLSGIKHVLSFLPHTVGKSALVSNTIQAITKVCGAAAIKRAPLHGHMLVELFHIWDMSKLINIRNMLLLLMLWLGMMRGAEVAQLRWSDLSLDSIVNKEHGKVGLLILKLSTTKTKNLSKGDVVVLASPPLHNELRLFGLLQQYRRVLAAQQLKSIYVFPHLNDMHKSLTTASVRAIVKQAAQALGLDPSLYGAHSGRVGGVTDAVAAGIPIEVIKKHGRWASNCWFGYFNDPVYAHYHASTALLSAIHKA